MAVALVENLGRTAIMVALVVQEVVVVAFLVQVLLAKVTMELVVIGMVVAVEQAVQLQALQVEQD